VVQGRVKKGESDHEVTINGIFECGKDLNFSNPQKRADTQAAEGNSIKLSQALVGIGRRRPAMLESECNGN